MKEKPGADHSGVKSIPRREWYPAPGAWNAPAGGAGNQSAGPLNDHWGESGRGGKASVTSAVTYLCPSEFPP